MDSQKDKKNSALAIRIIALVFVTLLLSFGILILVLPKAEYSSLEKRVLSKHPALTSNSVLSGSYMEDVEAWISDTFPGRSLWVRLSSGLRSLFGISESDDTVLSKDDYLIERFTEADKSEVQDLLIRFLKATGISSESSSGNSSGSSIGGSVDGSVGGSVDGSASDSVGGSASILIVPDAVGTIQSDAELSSILPAGFPTDNESDWLEQFYSSFKEKLDAAGMTEKVALIDSRDALAAEWIKGNQVYYRTDHHWTTKGAYTAFSLWKATVLPNEPALTYEAHEVCSSFYGTLSARLPFASVSDSVEIYHSDKSPEVLVNYEEEDRITTSLYSADGLTGGDPYEVFLGGNYPIITIRTTAKTDRKLLLIKDSYANAFIGFLTPYYSEITVIDPRYYNGDLLLLAKQGRFDHLLILYNANTFSEDSSLQTVLEAALAGKEEP